MSKVNDLLAITCPTCFCGCRWGIFRDRRPDLYTPLVTLDGSHKHAALSR
jgi:hypothetical protein